MSFSMSWHLGCDRDSTCSAQIYICCSSLLGGSFWSIPTHFLSCLLEGNQRVLLQSGHLGCDRDSTCSAHIYICCSSPWAKFLVTPHPFLAVKATREYYYSRGTWFPTWKSGRWLVNSSSTFVRGGTLGAFITVVESSCIKSFGDDLS